MTDRAVRRVLLGLLLATLGGGVWGGSAAAPPGAPPHAVILLYHHVADDTPASTSVTPATFDAHLSYLADNDYQVVPLSRIIDALTGTGGGQATRLPPRAVAITFDDAYASVYAEAAPRLARHGYPYTVFVSTDYIDRDFGGYMSWDQLRALESQGGAMANHSRDHGHYVHRRRDEPGSSWRRRIAADVRYAQSRLVAELAQPLMAFAYPYGEFDPPLTALLRELGFAAFGQQSGPVGPASDPQALPRFPMASRYADLDGLAEKLRTVPFRVTVLSDAGPVLPADGPAPTLRLRLEAGNARLAALSCFVSGQPAPLLRWLDRDAGIVEVTARAPLPVGRSKYTCTAPSSAGGGVFYWYSHLWMKPPAPGEWYPD